MKIFRLLREDKARENREGLYQQMMLRHLRHSTDKYNTYWPEECRPLNEADYEYISNFDYHMIIDRCEGLHGYLINKEELTREEIKRNNENHINTK